MARVSLTKITSWKNNPLLRNAGWMLVGQGTSVVLQAGYFILLARLLGTEQYGVFAGAFALVAIVAPYASVGAGTLFMRYAGADSTKTTVFLGHIVLASICFGSFTVFTLHLLAPHLLNPASASLVLWLGMAQCVFTQLVNNMSQVFQAFEQLKITAFLSLLINASRFCTVLLITRLLNHATAWQWSLVSAVIAGISAFLCLLYVIFRFGKPSFRPRHFFGHIPEGLGYSLGGSAQSVYNDVDKTLLSHYAMNVENGIYTTAYRIVDIATLPITALDAAALPRYFREAKDKNGVMRLAERLGRKAALAGLGIALLLFLSAGLLPNILGQSYIRSVSALRWLCFVPALRGWHQLTGSAIAGMGYQKYRTIAQFSAAGINLALNLFAIPRFGWLGAAWVSLISDGILCLFHTAIFQVLKKRHGEEKVEDSEDALAVLADGLE